MIQPAHALDITLNHSNMNWLYSLARAWSIFLLLLSGVFLTGPINLNASESIPTILTTEQQHWVDQNPTVDVAIIHRPPFMFAKDGEVRGLAIDQLSLILKKIGISPNYLIFERDQAMDLIRHSKKPLILPFIGITPDLEESIRFTPSVYSSHSVIVTHPSKSSINGISDVQEKRIAIVAPAALYQQVIDYHPKLPLQIFDNYHDAIQSLERGRSDAFIGDLSVTSWDLQFLGLMDLSIASTTGLPPIKLAFGVHKDYPLLANLIEQGYNATPDSQREMVKQHWLMKRYKVGLNERQVWFWGSLSSFVALLIIIAIWYRGNVLKLEVIRRTELEKKLENLATHDPLTGLLNRNKLDQLFDIEVKRSQRHQHQLSLILLDLDFFKHINDQHGHLSGDRVLQNIGQLLTENLRATDFAFRIGGEEFICLLSNTHQDQAFQVAENLRKIIEQHIFLNDKGEHITVTASMGVVSYPSDGDNYEALYKQVDMRLYKAKHNGRNQVIGSNGQDNTTNNDSINRDITDSHQ